MAWLAEIGSHPILGSIVCGLLALLTLVVRQLVHRSRLLRRLDASFTLIIIGSIVGAIDVGVRATGWSGAAPYLNAVVLGMVGIGIVRAALTVFVDFYLQQRGGAVVSAIFRDVASVVAYFLVIVVVLRSTLDINLASLIATSAVLTVIVGLALQDVLGNLFSGLVLELEQSFSYGDWIRVGTFEGRVEETGWRTTKIRTRVNELVTLPNALLSKEAVVNFSRPESQCGDTLFFGAAYDAPPNMVRDAVLRVLDVTPGVLSIPVPEVRLQRYAESSVDYAIRYWISDFGELERIRNRIMTSLWYALRRANVRIPLPARDVFVHREAPDTSPSDSDAFVATLRRVPLLAPLSDAALATLSQRVRRQAFGRGEVVVREGEPGDSFYVIEHGTAEVMLGQDGAAHPVNQLHAGDFFGEMSLLAGERRTATVRAGADLTVLMIDHAAFKEIITADPAILEPLSEIAAQRQASQHEQRRRVALPNDTAEAQGAQRLHERIKAFFGL